MFSNFNIFIIVYVDFYILLWEDSLALLESNNVYFNWNAIFKQTGVQFI